MYNSPGWSIRLIRPMADRAPQPDVYKRQGESAALRAVDALQNNIDKLMRFPRMGEEHPDEYLKVLNFCKLAHDNHIVIYRVDTETVIIERIVWASSNYPELFQQGVPTL